MDLFIVHSTDYLKMKLLPRFAQWKCRGFEDKDGKEHHRRGVRIDKVTIEVVRPDRYMGIVCGEEELQRIDKWMDEFMVVWK